jgi:hypothetical protein
MSRNIIIVATLALLFLGCAGDPKPLPPATLTAAGEPTEEHGGPSDPLPEVHVPKGVRFTTTVTMYGSRLRHVNIESVPESSPFNPFRIDNAGLSQRRWTRTDYSGSKGVHLRVQVETTDGNGPYINSFWINHNMAPATDGRQIRTFYNGNWAGPDDCVVQVQWPT